MGCTLGCVSEYRAYIAARGGSPNLSQEPLPVRTGEFTRLLDGVSSATVRLNASPECCGLLERVRSWMHELVIYRDEQRVWEGPIVGRNASVDEVTITARDVAIWLLRRPHYTRITTTGDLSRAAEAIITDALQPDDPNVLRYMEVFDCGVHGGRDYPARSAWALDSLNELAKTSIDYTVIGRSIMIGGPLSFGGLTQLTCDHFVNTPAVVEDGMAAATAATVYGSGVIGTAGGIDPHFGLVEQWAKFDQIKDKASANFAAQNLLAGANPPPLFIVPPSDSSLTPSAPVCMEQLVPGALVPMRIDCTCIQAQQMMRLVGVQVQWDENGDKVRPAFETPGAYS